MATLHATLPDNAVTNIVIGSKLADVGMVVDYSCIRGALRQAGRIRVLSKVTSIPEPLHQWFGDDAGIADFATPITGDISGNDIRLNITVNNSSVDDVNFHYNVALIKL